MDATLLARIQFGVTVGFHYIFPQITIGLGWLIFWMMLRWVRTGREIYRSMARFWTGVFALSFAIGVASGIVMEFQFGTNWADYSRYVGDIFGAPLAAEGVIAFFLESTFLGFLLFGWNKLKPKTHLIASFFVAFGASLSALWIIIANSWQQTPAGYVIANGRAELTDFFAAAINHSTVIRYLHVVDGALMAGAFFVLGLSASFLLKKKHVAIALESIKLALILGLVATAVQFIFGHHHALQVANTQPTKLAAFEGHFDTGANAPLLVFGIPDADAGKTHLAIGVPGLLSFMLSGGDANYVVKGLNDWPKEDWPPLLLTFFPFHLMVAFWFLMLAIMVVGAVLYWRGTLADNRLFQMAALAAIPVPILTNTLGWITAEVGRQPWAVYGLLRTKDSISKSVSAAEVAISLAFFTAIYLLLLGVWIFLVRHRLEQGPPAYAEASGGEVKS